MTHTFDIVMAVFDIGQNVVSGAAGVIHGSTSIDIDSTIAQMRTGMENMGVGELLGLSIETLLISLCLKIMAILITVILYGRMIEIYCASRSAACNPQAVRGHFGNPALASR